MNLLSNAYKFTLEGHIALKLRQIENDFVELIVEDTGTGIPPEEIGKLFQRFHRVNGANGRSHEGTGIGLGMYFFFYFLLFLFIINFYFLLIFILFFNFILLIYFNIFFFFSY